MQCKKLQAVKINQTSILMLHKYLSNMRFWCGNFEIFGLGYKSNKLKIT